MSTSRTQVSKVVYARLGRNQWGLCGLLLLYLAVAVPVAEALADEPNRAGLVVRMDDGRVEALCVAFEEDAISGAELLARSGLDHIIDPASGMGLIVCQIGVVGCDYPAEPCFCQCMGGGECIYWNYFYRGPGEDDWTYSAMGAAMHQVKAGSVDAWVWGDGHTPPAAKLGFDAICVPATPVASETPAPSPTMPASPGITPTATVTATPPTTALPSVIAAGPSATSRAATPTALPTPTTPPSGSPEPASADGQDLAAYWPFGLLILGLAAVGGIVWLRRR